MLFLLVMYYYNVYYLFLIHLYNIKIKLLYILETLKIIMIIFNLKTIVNN